jgi:hypothetical protein
VGLGEHGAMDFSWAGNTSITRSMVLAAEVVQGAEYRDLFPRQAPDG